MGRPRHPSKEIDKAVRHALSLGWRLVHPAGHAWGRLLCPHTERDGCKFSVWSTPRNPESHARHIIREVDGCPHAAPAAEDPGEDERDEG